MPDGTGEARILSCSDNGQRLCNSLPAIIRDAYCFPVISAGQHHAVRPGNGNALYVRNAERRTCGPVGIFKYHLHSGKIQRLVLLIGQSRLCTDENTDHDRILRIAVRFAHYQRGNVRRSVPDHNAQLCAVISFVQFPVLRIQTAVLLFLQKREANVIGKSLTAGITGISLQRYASIAACHVIIKGTVRIGDPDDRTFQIDPVVFRIDDIFLPIYRRRLNGTVILHGKCLAFYGPDLLAQIFPDRVIRIQRNGRCLLIHIIVDNPVCSSDCPSGHQQLCVIQFTPSCKILACGRFKRIVRKHHGTVGKINMCIPRPLRVAQQSNDGSCRIGGCNGKSGSIRFQQNGICILRAGFQSGCPKLIGSVFVLQYVPSELGILRENCRRSFRFRICVDQLSVPVIENLAKRSVQCPHRFCSGSHGVFAGTIPDQVPVSCLNFRDRPVKPFTVRKRLIRLCISHVHGQRLCCGGVQIVIDEPYLLSVIRKRKSPVVRAAFMKHLQLRICQTDQVSRCIIIIYTAQFHTGQIQFCTCHILQCRLLRNRNAGDPSAALINLQGIRCLLVSAIADQDRSAVIGNAKYGSLLNRSGDLTIFHTKGFALSAIAVLLHDLQTGQIQPPVFLIIKNRLCNDPDTVQPGHLQCMRRSGKACVGYFNRLAVMIQPA